MSIRQIENVQPAAGGDGGPPLGRMMLRRKWLLLFGLAVGAGLGYLYFAQQPPVYESSVRILIIQERPPLANDPGQREISAKQDLATQCIALTSEVVLKKAAETLADKPEFGSREAALAKLAGGMRASPVQLDRTDTAVVEVTYRGAAPGECRLGLEAVLTAYKDFLSDSDQSVSQQIVTTVTDAKTLLEGDLKKLGDEYATFRRGLPLLSQGEKMINPHAVKLTEIDAERTGLVLQGTQIQSRIESIRAAIASGGSREALTLMVDQLRENGQGQSSGAVVIAEKLFPLLLERELLAQDLGKDHPKVRTIEQQIEMTRDHLNNLLDRTGASEGPRDLLSVYLASLQYELETIGRQETQLKELYKQVEQQAKALESDLATDRQLTQEIEQKTELLSAIVKRLDEMSLFNSSQGVHVQEIGEPGPGGRTPAKRNEFMIIGGVLGFIFAAALAYMLESSDKSFRTPEDVRDEIGAPVLGHVPVIAGPGKAQAGRLSPVLSTVHAPKGSSAEAFRLVRTALFFGARAGNLKVIQVTSPDQGDGKSTIAANLAVAIAHSGRKTLLIDADLRRPTVHKIFGLGNGPGLAETILGSAEPDDAIVESSVSNLSLLACGPRPHNPAELLADPGFEQLLDWARDRYDFVIVDTPPLLAVSDPGNVACRVDAVLLALRLGKRTRAKATEARDILDRVGANVLGVIVNGVNAKGDYGYRAGYHYTYSTSYRYRYGTSGASRYLEEDGRRSEAPLASSYAANGHVAAKQDDA